MIEEIYENLCWWQMVLSGLGGELLTFFAGAITLVLIFGLFFYIVSRL